MAARYRFLLAGLSPTLCRPVSPVPVWCIAACVCGAGAGVGRRRTALAPRQDASAALVTAVVTVVVSAATIPAVMGTEKQRGRATPADQRETGARAWRWRQRRHSGMFPRRHQVQLTACSMQRMEQQCSAGGKARTTRRLLWIWRFWGNNRTQKSLSNPRQ